jgi:hypothetical protein
MRYRTFLTTFHFGTEYIMGICIIFNELKSFINKESSTEDFKRINKSCIRIKTNAVKSQCKDIARFKVNKAKR